MTSVSALIFNIMQILEFEKESEVEIHFLLFVLVYSTIRIVFYFITTLITQKCIQ